MGSNETLCLRWNEFESNIKSGFSQLRNDEDFFDVTLACGSKHIKAHKVILSACSSFFRSLIKSIPHQHPLLYLRGIDFNHLESVLCFMYNGEVRIKPHELDQFLSIAQELKVNGLMQDQSTNGVNKFETTAPKRSISTTDDLSLHEVKRESSPPLHLQNKRIALSTTEEDEDSEIEDITPMGNSTMMGEPSNLEYQETDNDQGAYESSFQPEFQEEDSNFKKESEDGTVKANELLDAKIFELVSPKDPNGKYKCRKCSYSSSIKRDIKNHVEARHFVTNGFACDKCGGRYKTRHSLAMHKRSTHKKDMEFFNTDDL
ncbi:zinc finger and BTB domain-containing protein 24 [Lepeophtheirus salmonis]|uniref:zinc finger and BTB domain-containing protein 24 n=1 Tax=Lepeophtheirus salmonis TaxID=72036 RepID=UPI001AE9E2D3|nr:protein bric-a-brac 1-like [Lepeophtheirus salmonis]